VVNPTWPRSLSRLIQRTAILPSRQEAEDRASALVVLHVPEDAEVFFNDTATSAKGTMRLYETPALRQGEELRYTVRVVWEEDGDAVNHTDTIQVRAGEVVSVDVMDDDSPDMIRNSAAELAKLSPEDRQLAQQQGYCAVQERVRLGSLGPIVKVMVQGQPVFVCSPACEQAVRKNETQILKKAEQLKTTRRVNTAAKN
jgi:uncharacterized protein (TIGR03000 family)